MQIQSASVFQLLFGLIKSIYKSVVTLIYSFGQECVIFASSQTPRARKAVLSDSAVVKMMATGTFSNNFLSTQTEISVYPKVGCFSKKFRFLRFFILKKYEKKIDTMQSS